MADVVVDASVWVSRLLAGDVHHAASNAWFARNEAEGALFVAPALLLPEVAGAIARRTRAAALGRRGVELLLRVRALRLVPIQRRLALRAARLAAELGLRGVDALYVAVAEESRLPLVTWDREQRRRASPAVEVSSAS